MNQASRDVIQRLLRYKDVLMKLKAMVFVRVFSDNLSDSLGVSPSLVRKDFSAFGLTGNKRGGYRIEELTEKLGAILGTEDIQKVILVGCGKLGTALMNYRGFSRQRIRIVAGFDSNPAKLDPHAPIPVLDQTEMSELVHRENIRIAVSTVPESAASQTADSLMAAGIRGILNFAPVNLKGSESCVIHNINVAMELENLFYFVRLDESKFKGN